MDLCRMNFIAIFSNYLFYSCKVLIYILNNICLILYFYSYFLLHYVVFFRNRIKHFKALRREEGQSVSRLFYKLHLIYIFDILFKGSITMTRGGGCRCIQQEEESWRGWGGGGSNMINCYTIPITKCAGAYREIGEGGNQFRKITLA